MFTAHLDLSSITTSFDSFQSSLLGPILVCWSTISGPLLILAPRRYVLRNIPKAISRVLDTSPIGSYNGYFMAPLSFATTFLTLDKFEVLSIDSQNLHLSTLARLIAFLHWHCASWCESQSTGPIFCRATLNFLWCASGVCSTPQITKHSLLKLSSPGTLSQRNLLRTYPALLSPSPSPPCPWFGSSDSSACPLVHFWICFSLCV